jgi:predicted metal-binding membrane protein
MYLPQTQAVFDNPPKLRKSCAKGGSMIRTLLDLRSLCWLAFFGVILLSWIVLFDMARMSGLDWLGRPVGMNMMPMTTFGALAPMWAIMMAAMMLPSLVPALSTYEALIRSADGTRAGWIGVVLGYFAVWLIAAVVLAGLQAGLMSGGVLDTLGAATSVWVAGGLLVVVGGYQFTRLKEICHGVCHSPMTYYLGHWRTGFSGGARMGAGLGSYCAGCCWGIMALGFVGGTMSLLWMGLATLFMVLEKLPQVAHVVSRPVGAALVAAGLGVIVYAATGM